MLKACELHRADPRISPRLFADLAPTRASPPSSPRPFLHLTAPFPAHSFSIRIPFGWQYATGGTVGGELDATFLALIDSYVQETLSLQAYAILDLHNYARWNSGVVGVDGPTNEQVRPSLARRLPTPRCAEAVFLVAHHSSPLSGASSPPSTLRTSASSSA